MPFELLRCIGQAVLSQRQASHALIARHPFDGDLLVKVAEVALAEWKGCQNLSERRRGLEALVRSSPDEERTLAVDAALKVAPVEARRVLMAYLEAVPDRVRRALTDLPDLSLEEVSSIRSFLPPRAPRYRRLDEIEGGFVLHRLLGIGGFGEVWLALEEGLLFSNLHFNPYKAIKFFIGDDAARKARHEKKILELISNLGQHPGIVRLVDYNLDAKPPFLIYDYIEGGELGTLIRSWTGEKPADRVDRSLRILSDLADVLAFLHRQPIPIVHRDMKPANVLLERTKDGFAVRVTDLGIGNIVAQDVIGRTRTIQSIKRDLWSSTQEAMTILYASPEQIKQESAHPRDDVYALGVLGYQMLMGDLSVKPPPDWKSTLLGAEVPQPVVALLGKCLCLASRRYHDAGALDDELKPITMAREGEARLREESLRREKARLRREEEVRLLEEARRGDEQQRWALAHPSRLTLGGIDFAWIPPGTFLMGSPGSEESRGIDEKQRTVNLTRGYYLGIYPITQAKWREVMGDNPSYFSRTGRLNFRVASLSHSDLDRFPVENVSAIMAGEFCKKLNQRLGKSVTLPTEAQWEYACRAGTTTPFHFGSILNGEQANCNGNAPYGTTTKGPFHERPLPVGSYAANAWGLHDLHGNVWEWCARTADSEVDGVIKPNHSVLRGGSWGFGAKSCRAAARRFTDSSYGDYNIGFRVAICMD